MSKKLLIIRACGANGEELECNNIKSHAELYGIETRDYCPSSNEELNKILGHGEKFDYIYLSSHGNASGFCNEASSINYSWFDFGMMLCSSMCMNSECIVMLSCCRGGLNQVAYLLFCCCGKISYIVGPRQNMYPNEMLMGFNLLLFNLEHRNIDPIVACEKILQGTDIRFVCFDRVETEGEMSFQFFKQQLDDALKNMINDTRIAAHETPLEPNV